MKVIWSRESLRRLIEIENYIAKDNPERAIKFIDKIIDRGEDIKNFPLRGRIVPEFSNNDIREVLENSYRIVYRISKTRVEILTIFEGHKLFPVSDIKNK
ncbi:MAG TPA: type II toxin-antitoxin system RelE/ParE family toxin [Ignavibacteriaceae bacterium]|nr:type II toxin-antitoxin system RelE/ParE family toxin [Ignavibacteriaceae bacterium]